ncbi:type II toxin-antitoxin system VapC family toxin [Spirulina sp. CCNP1310]|uniref:type II toxin-antitoxin system VapC family toxin n=1 Tax=Spirulina sp. CCNP1310 TaxID=3110249 RepID=UPI002B208E88|nr:type II toxin-antitoxin system VapC family toxin [Spirulina sp. CCNP1310]MEA5421148.1 type II toxin-antitoxin system VapC family toxin [Spirulina sp. CCNP1310]
MDVTYLLDTNVCIKVLNSSNSFVNQRLLSIPKENIRLCTIVYSELYYGVCRSTQYQKNLNKINGLFDEFIVVPFDMSSAKVAGEIRAELAIAGNPIGANDLLIAAIAIANSLTLVTHNTREFGRIQQLVYEDWES